MKAEDYVDFSFPDREMVSEYLKKAQGFITNIEEFLRQEEGRVVKKFKNASSDKGTI